MRNRAAIALLVGATALTAPLAISSSALAQGDDAITEVARQRYNDGVKAYDAGRFEEARAAFLQAYALKRHPAVLLNLAQAEIRAGYPVDAGNHFQQFLREHKEATPDQKAAANAGIEQAKKRAPYVIVIVDANGADVSLDGTNVGQAPIVDPVFVQPGQHTFVASYQGKSATTSVDAKVGPAIAANLTLGTTGAPPPMVGAPVAPMAPVQQQPAQNNGFQFGGPPPPGDTTSDDTEREPFLDWYTDKPLAWVGTGVTGLGLLTGVIFSITASSAASSADDTAAAIQAEADKDGIGAPCGPEDDPSQDLEKYSQACNVLRDDLSDRDTSVALATTGWVFAGIGAAFTVTYIMVDWFPGKKKGTAAGPIDEVIVAPLVTPDQRGIGVMGTF